MNTTDKVILNKENCVFEKTDGGFVSLSYEDTQYLRVKFIRLFPFSDPNRFISVRDSSQNDMEIGVIENLDFIDEKQRTLIEEQLDLYYFTPIITKVLGVKDEYGYAYFHVMTDHGECKFTINMGANAVTKLSAERLIITDIDGNRFEIKCVTELSVKEQRKLDLFL